jgi:hypothetical protein
MEEAPMMAGSEARNMLDRLIRDFHQSSNKAEASKAKADPVAFKKTRVFDGGARLNYQFYGGRKNGRGHAVRFCWATNRNAAGYFLAWREVISKKQMKRDMWIAHKVRNKSKAACSKRFSSWEAQQAKRSELS